MQLRETTQVSYEELMDKIPECVHRPLKTKMNDLFSEMDKPIESPTLEQQQSCDLP